VKAAVSGMGGGIDSMQDIPDALLEQNVPLSSINSIIWSHSHIDHVGDPSVFPASTELIVGPTLLSTQLPGYPADPSGFLLESAFKNRNVREIDFSESTLEIGGFRAVDFFSDGSFYVLDGVGHTANHIMALARTTEDSFVLMAGDSCHHVGQLRPSADLPLPESIPASAVKGFSPSASTCSCAQFKPLLPTSPQLHSFYDLSHTMHEDHVQAEETVRKVKNFDASDEVLVVIAHDASLVDVLDFYPESLNLWKEKGVDKLGRWRFLGDFVDAVAKD
jgi:hypothetical protein